MRFACEVNDLAVGGRLLDLRTPYHTLAEIYLSLHGEYQGDNASCALAATEAFFSQPVDEDVVAQAFGSISVPGRFEVVGHEPLVVLDGAHNPEAAAATAATLREDFMQEGRRIVVAGMLQPRDPFAILEALDVDDSTLVIACLADSPRAIPTAEVVSAASSLGADALEEPDVGRAIDRARRLATPDDVVLVTGSLYVVGSARTHLGL